MKIMVLTLWWYSDPRWHIYYTYIIIDILSFIELFILYQNVDIYNLLEYYPLYILQFMMKNFVFNL